MSERKAWTAEQIPDQSGRVVLITGANSGLGFESTLALARKEARVIMACRNMEKAERAQILGQVPEASLELLPLDLANLESVREAAAQVNRTQTHLDVLMNNAGVMATPRRKTADGFELQFGSNHLGPFALTGLLLET
jgi:NAD(P)-dependent dehydrogenase (short-subunit alcohol dehydrogenase family)